MVTSDPEGWEITSRFTVRLSSTMGFTNPALLLALSSDTVRTNSLCRKQGHTRVTRWSPGGRYKAGIT